MSIIYLIASVTSFGCFYPDNFYNSFNYLIFAINSFSLFFTAPLLTGGPAGFAASALIPISWALKAALAASSPSGFFSSGFFSSFLSPSPKPGILDYAAIIEASSPPAFLINISLSAFLAAASS